MSIIATDNQLNQYNTNDLPSIYGQDFLKDPMLVDKILSSNLPINEKINLINTYTNLLELNNIKTNGGITSTTLTILFENKEESTEYLNLLKKKKNSRFFE